jgi:integrase
MPLTDAKLRQAEPREKSYKLYDSNGLLIQVPPSGSLRWRFNYQHNGKAKTLSLGTYPLISLKQAREKRDHFRQLLLEGIDPSAQRQANRRREALAAENSFELVAREWHGNQSNTWAPSHSKRVLARLELDIFPLLGKLDIADIEAPELLAALRRIEDRGALESAKRVKTICGQVFRYGIATGRCKRDVARDLHGSLKKAEKTNFAATIEPVAVGALLRKVYAYQATVQVMAAMKIAPHVFVRAGELRAMKWEDVDFEKAQWCYHVTKTKSEHIVPLSTQVIELLQDIQQFTGHRPYVFPSAKSGNRPMSDAALTVALRSMGVAKEDHTIHGWRATAKTRLEEGITDAAGQKLEFRTEAIELQLAHKVKDSNGTAYNRTKHLDTRTAMMQAYSDYLDQLRAGADVIDIVCREAVG